MPTASSKNATGVYEMMAFIYHRIEGVNPLGRNGSLNCVSGDFLWCKINLFLSLMEIPKLSHKRVTKKLFYFQCKKKPNSVNQHRNQGLVKM